MKKKETITYLRERLWEIQNLSYIHSPEENTSLLAEAISIAETARLVTKEWD